MKSSLRLAGAAVLCASLLLTACAKSHESSTSTTTDATKTTDTSIAATPGSGTSAPDSTTATAATAAPGEASTVAPAATGTTTTTTATSAAAADGMTFIDIPAYPGAAELKDQSMAMSSNGSSVVIKAYATKDDTKRVIDWYKSHLPASWKNFQLSSGDKTTGTFSSEGTGGDQTVLIATQDDKTTRIQLSTKHGK